MKRGRQWATKWRLAASRKPQAARRWVCRPASGTCQRCRLMLITYSGHLNKTDALISHLSSLISHHLLQQTLINLHHRLSSLPLVSILLKPQANTIHTMPLIRGRRIPLSLEHMSQMSPTVTAHDFRPFHSKRAIRMSCNRPRNRIKVRGPATSRLELV